MDRFRIRTPFTIHETVDGEVVVVNLETGSYYSLVGTGARIWAGVERTATAREIVVDLHAAFEHGGIDVEDAVRRFLEELAREGLIEPSAGANDLADGGRAPGPGDRRPFAPPVLQKFTDMQHLILLDPVHEVEEEKGWPHAKTDG